MKSSGGAEVLNCQRGVVNTERRSIYSAMQQGGAEACCMLNNLKKERRLKKKLPPTHLPCCRLLQPLVPCSVAKSPRNTLEYLRGKGNADNYFDFAISRLLLLRSALAL